MADLMGFLLNLMMKVINIAIIFWLVFGLNAFTYNYYLHTSHILWVLLVLEVVASFFVTDFVSAKCVVSLSRIEAMGVRGAE